MAFQFYNAKKYFNQKNEVKVMRVARPFYPKATLD